MKYNKLIAGVCGFAITASMLGQTVTTSFASENYNQVVKNNHVYNVLADGVDWDNPVTVDPNADYYELMKKALSAGEVELAAKYEEMYNQSSAAKISFLKEGVGSGTASDILKKIEGAEKVSEWKTTMSFFSSSEEYLPFMLELANDGSDEAMKMGKEANRLMNLKIKEEGGYAIDWWFYSKDTTPEEIAKSIEEKIAYNERQKQYEDMDFDNSEPVGNYQSEGMGERYPQNDNTGYDWYTGDSWDDYDWEHNYDYEATVSEGGYPVAEHIVQRLRDEGFSDITISGILGNMMDECGGHTLKLRWNAYGYMTPDDPYYGLCQWSLYYNPEVKDLDVDGQLDYLMKTIAPNMKMFGGSIDEFCSLTSPVEAALYYQQYYERGENGDRRAQDAIKAYNWIKNI